MKLLSPAELAARTDSAWWKPATTASQIEAFCSAAARHQFRAVCLPTSRVELAYTRLEETGVKVVALVDFPLGTAATDTKRFETEVAIDLGAHEIEMVLNIGRLKEGDHRYVLRELRDVAEAADERPVSVILETGLLTAEEVKTACALVLDSGAEILSTGTGFGTQPQVSPEQIQRLREALGPKFLLKAVVGTLDAPTASALLEAGASRFGTTAAL